MNTLVKPVTETKKTKLLWYTKGNLGDCILACYSLMKIDQSLVDITICTNKNNSKIIRDLNLPFNIIEVNNSIISSIKSFALFEAAHLFFHKIFSYRISYDVSIDPYRWRSGFLLEQVFSFSDSIKLNRFNSSKKINFSKSELNIHEQFFIIGNIPFSANSNFPTHIKSLVGKDDCIKRFDIIIHPFSSEKTRILSYELVLNIIKSHPNEKILLLGTPSDDRNLIFKLINLKIKNLTIDIKYFNFSEVARLIILAKIIYGSESFISNFASLLGAKVYAFFSGVADPNQWYLPSPTSTTFRLDVPCAPCFNKIACGNECLDLLAFSRSESIEFNNTDK